MYDSDADLRTLYQAYTDKIGQAKTQLWRVVNYGIWTIAGVLGLFRGFIDVLVDWGLLLIFPTITIIILFVALYNMVECWYSMIDGRQKAMTIRSNLSGPFQSMWNPSDNNYENWKYDRKFVFPLMFIMGVGALLAYILQLTNVGIQCFRQFIDHFWPLLPSIIVFIYFSIRLGLHFRHRLLNFYNG